MSSEGSLIVEVREDVLWVRIDRPQQRNALSRALLREIGAAFSRHAGDAGLKAAVLTGEGSQAFAAGGDLREFASLRSERAASELFSTAQHALDEVRRFPLPVVAALNGIAVGGGAELAVACDFRVAARHASIGYVHGRLNISTGFGGGTDLMRLLGPSRALLCMLRAEVLSADEARALGLIDDVAAEGEALDDCVTRFVAPVRGRTPQVIRACKAMALAARTGATAEERLCTELAGFVATWCAPEHWSAAERVLARGRSERP
jgi:enoyl-CoA hydratase